MQKRQGEWRAETLAVHAGASADGGVRAVASPIVMSTTFERQPDGTYSDGYIYSRNGNPNREELEGRVCALEGGAAAAAFASGSAATSALLQALSPGDHVLAPTDAYYGTTKLLAETFARWGLQVSFADMTDLAGVEKALRPNTRLVWVETPSNPLLKITDIAAVAQLAHGEGALLACDNTWATPILQRPFERGADLVMHSTTKYLGGHSDLLGGLIVAKEESELFARVRAIQASGGAVPSPLECWLAARSIQTLPYRMRAHSDNAVRVARFLAEHPGVERVHYPGLESHPGYEVAQRQMSAPGGMLSFQVKGSAAGALRVAGSLHIISHATSLGGVESLIDHRASVEGPGSRTPENLLRLSVGLEHPDDLTGDLEQALASLEIG